MKTILALMLITWSLNSAASDWRFLTYNETTTLYIDASSAVNMGATKKAWFQMVFKKPQKVLTKPSSFYDSSKMLWIFNCSDRTTTTKQSTDYLGNEVVDSYSSAYLTYSEITPDSFAEAAYDYLCKPSS